MSVTTAIAALATALYAVNPAPQSPPRTGCIFTDPREAVTLANFPSIVICLSPSATHTWTEEALGLARHDYTLAIYVFLGIRQTPLPELHARALPWPEAIMRVLANNITLGGVVNQLGFGGDPRMYTYRIGPIPWGTGPEGTPLVYWGLTLQLPVVEKPPMEMGPGI